MKNKAIFGFGGFASEVYAYIKPFYPDVIHFVDERYYSSGSPKLFSIKDFCPDEHELIIAVANPIYKQQIENKLPKETEYFSFIHESVIIANSDVIIGDGSIICPNCVLTTDIILGKHVHLNIGTTIGHNSRIGNYFTSAPAVNISGNCNIKDKVYFGTNSCIKEKIHVCENVTIGMGACVSKNIDEEGTYVGVPARKILI
jgi:sugar O-acyltransferase (sialic acid O-acetyltransferase NeuD family)